METKYPGYGFAVHKGYPTAAHMEALNRLGPCPEHRQSFGPVAEAIFFHGGQYPPGRNDIPPSPKRALHGSVG